MLAFITKEMIQKVEECNPPPLEWNMIKNFLTESSVPYGVARIKEAAEAGQADLVRERASLLKPIMDSPISNRFIKSAYERDSEMFHDIIEQWYNHHAQYGEIDAWQDQISKMCAGFIKAYFPENEREVCFGRLRNCRVCEYHYTPEDEGVYVCPQCFTLRTPCLHKPTPNGRCGFHGGRNMVERGPGEMTTAEKMAMSFQSTRLQQQAMAVMQSPDLLSNVGDIVALTTRQIQLKEEIGEVDVFHLREIIPVALARIRKAEGMNKINQALREIELLLIKIDRTAAVADKWAETRENAALLMKLRDAERKAIREDMEMLTMAQHRAILEEITSALALAIKGVSSQIATKVIEGEIVARPESKNIAQREIEAMLRKAIGSGAREAVKDGHQH